MSVIPNICAPNAPPVDRVRHGFYGSSGGVSTGIYASLNVGEGSDDDPAAVARNRARVAKDIGAATASDLKSVYQVHGRDVVQVGRNMAERPPADAMVTGEPGLALCILTADCVPILFADEEAGIIGAAHAGWKGARAGVAEACIDAMVSLGARVERIWAAIGPAIRQESYEVGPEFRSIFLDDAAGHARYFQPGIADRFHFDLTGYVADRLTAQNLAVVEDVGLDTCALDGQYFSNRRRYKQGLPDYGRNASVIMLVP